MVWPDVTCSTDEALFMYKTTFKTNESDVTCSIAEALFTYKTTFKTKMHNC